MELASDKMKSINCDPNSRLGKIRTISLDAYDKFADSSERLLQQLGQGAKLNDIDDLIQENLKKSATYQAASKDFMNALDVAVHEVE